MRSCKEIAQLMTPGNNLTFFQKMEAKMHLFVCELCRKYEKQLKFLSKAQNKHIEDKMRNSENKISEIEDEVINNFKNKSQ